MESNEKMNSQNRGWMMEDDGCPGILHRVERGDTLYLLGKKYQVSVAAIMYANPFADIYNLQVGDELCIPRIMPRGSQGMGDNRRQMQENRQGMMDDRRDMGGGREGMRRDMRKEWEETRGDMRGEREEMRGDMRGEREDRERMTGPMM